MITPKILQEKLDQYGEQILQGAIAKIELFNKSSLKAKVQPLLKKKRKNSYEALPVIIDVPVNTFYSNNTLIIPDYKRDDLVWIGVSSFPVSNQIKGIYENITPNKFGLENAVVIAGFSKQPFVINPSLIKDGLVIAHKDGTYIRVYKDEIDIIIDSSTSIKMKKDEVTIKSKKVILDGDASIKGKLEVDKDVIWNNATTPTHSSTHIHGTGTGPSASPNPGS